MPPAVHAVNPRTALLVMIAVVTSAVLVSSIATGGPLDPPPGPITGTDARLLNQQGTVFPIVIDEPGVYRLTSDLEPPAGVTAIEVGANNVLVDLNGFALQGSGGMSIGIAPIPPTDEATLGVRYTNLRVTGGTISGWDTGISARAVNQVVLISSAFASAHISDLFVSECGTIGVDLLNGPYVERCRFVDNLSGLNVGVLGRVENCQFEDNTTHIATDRRCVIRDCTFHEGQVGVTSFSGHASAHIVIEDNVFLGMSNSAVSMIAAGRCFLYRNIIDDCTATPLTTLNSDVPISTSAAGAGPRDNIVP